MKIAENDYLKDEYAGRWYSIDVSYKDSEPEILLSQICKMKVFAFSNTLFSLRLNVWFPILKLRKCKIIQLVGE